MKTHIFIYKSLNEVCKQATLGNLKRDNGFRENTVIDSEDLGPEKTLTSLLFFLNIHSESRLRARGSMVYYHCINRIACLLYCGNKAASVDNSSHNTDSLQFQTSWKENNRFHKTG